MMCFAFAWKYPRLWIIISTSSGFAVARAAGVGYAEKSGAFTLSTALSVVCAERMVRMSTSKAEPWGAGQENHVTGYCLHKRE